MPGPECIAVERYIFVLDNRRRRAQDEYCGLWSLPAFTSGPLTVSYVVEASMAVNWNVSKSDLPVDLLARVPKARALKVSGRSVPSLETIAQRVRAEYLEMPGLNLTREQARCLWALDADTCDQVL